MSAQLELPFTPEPHCPNCDPARDEENLRILASCDTPWLLKCLGLFETEMDLSGCTPAQVEAEEWHKKHRRELFQLTLDRRLAGEKRGAKVGPGREVRVPCRGGCGATTHTGGEELCRPCAQKNARKARAA